MALGGMLRRSAHRRGKTAAALSAFLAGACLLGGCKVLTIEEDRALRARRGADFDAASYVKDIWSTRVMPTIARAAVPVDTLLPAVDAGLGRAGARFGRQVGEGSAWTFVVKGVGQVRSIDMATRQGGIDLTLDGGSGDRTVRLQVGPVVSGSADPRCVAVRRVRRFFRPACLCRSRYCADEPCACRCTPATITPSPGSTYPLRRRREHARCR